MRRSSTDDITSVWGANMTIDPNLFERHGRGAAHCCAANGWYYVFYQFEETQGLADDPPPEFDPDWVCFDTAGEALAFVAGVNAAAERSGGYCACEFLSPREYLARSTRKAP